MNEHLFYIINNWRSPLIDSFMLLGTKLGDFWNLPFFICLLLALLWTAKLAPSVASCRWYPSNEKLIAVLWPLLIGYCIAFVIVSALKIGMDMPRPFYALPHGKVQILGEPESPYSFPSGHAAFVALVGGVLWPYRNFALRTGIVLFATWVGFSRISLGAHFPADVAAGYLCGALSAWLAKKVIVRIAV